MKKIYLSILILSMATAGCHDSCKEFSYKDSADSQLAFYSEKKADNIVEFPKAHSGKFVYKLDQTNPYSGTFYMNVTKVFPEKPIKALVSAWVYKTKPDAKLSFVLEIRDSSFVQKEWLSKDAMEKITKEKEWVYVEFEFNLLTNNRSDPSNYLRAYLHNDAPSEIFVDDFEVRFI